MMFELLGVGGGAAVGALLVWLLRRVRVSGSIRIDLGGRPPPG